MITEVKRHELLLKSTPQSIIEVEPFIEAAREELQITEEVFGNVLVALTEAVNNAIMHGNRANPEKTVKVVASLNRHTISFVVSDEGPGFDYNNLPDPTAPENIEKPTGRGVFLMKELSDLVLFSHDGSVVEVQFKI